MAKKAKGGEKPAEEAAKRLVVVGKNKDGTRNLGAVVHLGYGCLILDGKECADVTGLGVFEGFPVCRICRHMKIGDYKKFPAVTIRPHILAELEKKYGARES